MTYFIVVMMQVLTLAGEVQFYIYTDPTFREQDKCIEFVQKNNYSIGMKAAAEYGFKNKPHSLYCLTKDEMLEMRKEIEGKTPEKLGA